jgi:hypothetical protein
MTIWCIDSIYVHTIGLGTAIPQLTKSGHPEQAQDTGGVEQSMAYKLEHQH